MHFVFEFYFNSGKEFGSSDFILLQLGYRISNTEKYSKYVMSCTCDSENSVIV
jgi:hypothetical protein